MKKKFEILKKILGAISFAAIVYMKVGGGDVGIMWLAIPALLMGVDLHDIAELFGLIKKK